MKTVQRSKFNLIEVLENSALHSAVAFAKQKISQQYPY